MIGCLDDYWSQEKVKGQMKRLSLHMDTLGILYVVCDSLATNSPHLLCKPDERQIMKAIRWRQSGYLKCRQSPSNVIHGQDRDTGSGPGCIRTQLASCPCYGRHCSPFNRLCRYPHSGDSSIIIDVIDRPSITTHQMGTVIPRAIVAQQTPDSDIMRY